MRELRRYYRRKTLCYYQNSLILRNPRKKREL